MRFLGVLSATAALLALLSPTLVSAAKKPTIHKKEFQNRPQTFFYFDDSPVILSLEQESGALWRSENDGEDWKPVEKIPEKAALDIYQHPFDKKKAFLLTKKNTHYVSGDRGKTWQTFDTTLPPTLLRNPLAFHAGKDGYILYTGMSCEKDEIWGEWYCEEETFYTKDGFDSDPKPLVEGQKTHGCMFARSTDLFTKGSDYSIMCILKGHEPNPEQLILKQSDDFFKTSREPDLDGERPISGVVGLAAVKKFIVAAVKSAGTDEMALFVTQDSENWDRAEFPSDHGGLKQDAYTILESRPYGIQVDVLTTTSHNPVGALFTSNSNGTYFTRNIDDTNRNRNGLVDFEQVHGIQGIVLVNIVENAAEVKKSNGNDKIEKKIQSKISFDGGRTFKKLKVKKSDDDLHVHSVTEIHNGGRVFSSPAPGILMAVGNTGKYLKGYNDGDLYVSDDAGITWKLARKDAHRYEFGDSGSILVAINDERRTDVLAYSLNHGDDWFEVDLGVEVRALALTTVPDSTSDKFTLIAETKDQKPFIFSINFEGVLERKCKSDDFEKWYARLDEKGQPDCLMGHKQYYNRRKKDANCYVGAEYKDPEVLEEVCECTDEDYECDFEFAMVDNTCKLVGKLTPPSGQCTKKGDKFKGSSGYRLIPGDNCKNGDKDRLIERPCEEDAVTPAPSTGKIKHVAKTFDAQGFTEYYYLERAASAEGKDETIVMRTDKNEIFITHDQGGEWEQPKALKDEEITAIYPNPYNSDWIFFLTPSKKYFYTRDRGKNIKPGIAPRPPTWREDISLALRFHPTKSDYIIWTGDRDCEDGFTAKGCHAMTYYSTSRGESWSDLVPYVRNCAWIHSDELKKTPEKLIFCERYEKDEKPHDDNPIKLIASDKFFITEEKTLFNKIMGFATMQEFIVVAAVKNDETLKLDASIDGSTFADAKFPHNFQVDKQQAYTVLDSITHAVFLHVTVNPNRGSEYGAILKSNSNGTSYVMSIADVNRNEVGYVDFEKMQGLEGVAIVNVVSNAKESSTGAKKKLKSMITHNDGGNWNLLTPPAMNANGKSYDCRGQKCSLHLHGYTRRKDPRDTFSSGSAIGVMIGVGNVGEYLVGRGEGNTYLTRDGGITWKEIRQGSYMWEYGDQGSIIVIVDENEPTDKVFFSLDEGGRWNEYNFGQKIKVEDITTIPSDTSRKFLLWGAPAGQSDKIITIQIDFTGLTDTLCKLPENDDDKDSDFELWEPSHPYLDKESRCLFGHRLQYYRKKLDRTCYVGPKLPPPKILGVCQCEKHDYECDFNYERGVDGICRLVPGLSPPNHEEACAADNNLVEWYEPTGYRRIPLTKCEGGKELDKSVPKPCKGHEKEFDKKHGASKGAVTLGVLFAIALAGAIGWFVWSKWNGKFGAIRLGEDSNGEQSPFVRYPIIAISAIIAVAVAIPAIVQAVVGWIVSKTVRPKRFTTRGSFARGNYAEVNTDEGELLGSDEEDEI